MLDAAQQGAFSFQLRTDSNESRREAMVLIAPRPPTGRLGRSGDVQRLPDVRSPIDFAEHDLVRKLPPCDLEDVIL
jgi:hypothetical protein